VNLFPAGLLELDLDLHRGTLERDEPHVPILRNSDLVTQFQGVISWLGPVGGPGIASAAVNETPDVQMMDLSRFQADRFWRQEVGLEIAGSGHDAGADQVDAIAAAAVDDVARGR